MNSSTLASLNSSEKRELLELLQERERRKARNRLNDYRPYRKQADFHEAGATHRERLFMAANQVGKTWAGGFETAMHLTGRYPEWWRGRRWDRPTHWMAGSESGELTRKGVQRILLGKPEVRAEWGTGAIPGATILNTTMRQGVADAVASIVVKHESGGSSTIQLNSYDQGRTKWQAETVDGVWFDEEPPEDVYFEGLTRTNATQGLVMVTFTPLKGFSEVVRLYLSDSDLAELKKFAA